MISQQMTLFEEPTCKSVTVVSGGSLRQPHSLQESVKRLVTSVDLWPEYRRIISEI